MHSNLLLHLCAAHLQGFIINYSRQHTDSETMGLKQLLPWAGNVISKLSNSYNNMFLGFMKRSDISIDMVHMPTSTFPKLYSAI